MDISAKKFYKEFMEMVNENKVELMNNFNSDKNYTNVIIPLLQKIVENFGFKSQKEFYRVDVIGYTDIDDIDDYENKKKYLNPCLWNTGVIIEHENNSYDWSYEVIKLVPIRCQLKVIICYNDYSKRKDKKLGDLSKLNIVLSWMKKIKYYDSEDEYLLIIGNTWYSGIKDFGYLGYIIKDNEIKCIKN